jgi:hypothetical protein
MTQLGYVNSMMMPNYQSSAGPMLMNANSGWLGQQVFLQTPQHNHQAIGFQQSQIYPVFQNQGAVNQLMNHGQQITGQQFGGQHLGGQQISGQQIGAQ